jgi:undecaprenyl diphosphate synthase
MISGENSDQPARPRHVVIIMDGNGRWAQARNEERHVGHQAGVRATRKVVESCADTGIESLTLFAFSSENWRRPEEEVSLLMELFLTTLESETGMLNRNNVCLNFIGNRQAFSEKLQDKIAAVENLTAANSGLRLNIAANYGGRWDIARATRQIVENVKAGSIELEDVDESLIQSQLCLSDQAEPDLFIRTGGERRISNFLLWQLAYTELYFTDTLWPDFDDNELADALDYYAGRQRRYGRTGEQVKQNPGNA